MVIISTKLFFFLLVIITMKSANLYGDYVDNQLWCDIFVFKLLS